jgi:hypothetical protein
MAESFGNFAHRVLLPLDKRHNARSGIASQNAPSRERPEAFSSYFHYTSIIYSYVAQEASTSSSNYLTCLRLPSGHQEERIVTPLLRRKSFRQLVMLPPRGHNCGRIGKSITEGVRQAFVVQQAVNSVF